MASRKRSRRSRGGPTVTPAPKPATPPDLITEIEQSIEARDRLTAALPGLKAQREQAKLAFLRSLAASLPPQLTPNAVRDNLKTWQEADARVAEQQDALQQLLDLFKARVEGFKTSSTSLTESASALQRIVARLSGELGKTGADKDALNARIASLSTELASLQTPVTSAPPRAVKDRPELPQRTAKKGSRKATAAKK